jgi:hypothetical protein
VLAAVVPVTAAHADQPPDLPDFPGDLANPTEDPEPPTPPVDNPSPSGDSIPAPQRIDAGFGGVAAGSHQAAGVALIPAASAPRPGVPDDLRVAPVRPPQPQVRRLGATAPWTGNDLGLALTGYYPQA